MACKTVHLIRHGQSTFNEATATTPWSDPMLFDAPLTPYGAEQAKALRLQVSTLGVELVVTSPLTRAIQTAMLAFADSGAAPIVVEALLRERLEASCDIGRPPRALAPEFPALSFDHLPDDWWLGDGGSDNRTSDPPTIVVEPDKAFADRVDAFVRWLESRHESRLAVVGHGAFFRALTGERFGNGQLRTARLDHGQLFLPDA